MTAYVHQEQHGQYGRAYMILADRKSIQTSGTDHSNRAAEYLQDYM